MYNFLSKILRRPVAVYMFYLGLLILGALSLGELDISLLPPLDLPVVTVSARYPGAIPEEVEQEIARPLEEALSSVNGVTEVISRSMQAEALVTVKLNWGADMKYAALNIRQQADRVYSRFPVGAERPVVNLRNPQNRPIATIAISGAPLSQLKHYAEYVIKKRLEQINGVAEASIMGAPEREIHIILNPDALSRRGFKISSVQKALRDNNIMAGGGSIKKGNFRLTLRLQSEYRSIEEIAETPVFKENSQYFVPLSKLAIIEDGFKEPESITRINGKPCIAIDVRKESGANTLLIHESLLEALDHLRSAHKSLELKMVFSQADFVRDALSSVSNAIIMGALLSVIVLFFFLSSWRAPLIIAFSIPVSVIAAFLWMNFSGVGINVISLAGLALGGGMLVDNSIIALENIHRHREAGADAFKAAVRGVSEVALPITAATLTTIAVFIPVIFLKDLSSAIFTEQAKTVSYALIVSLIVGLTLLPVLYLSFEKKQSNKTKERRVSFDYLTNYYDRALTFTLRHSNAFLLFVFILLIAACSLLFFLDRRLLPDTEQHAVEIYINYLPGVSLDYIAQKSSELENGVIKDEHITLTFTEMGKKSGVFHTPDERKLNRSFHFLKLPSTVKSSAVLNTLRDNAPHGEKIQLDFRKTEPALSGVLGSNSAPLSLYITGPDLTMLDSLSKIVTKFITRKYPDAVYASNFFERYPAIVLSIDRAKSARYGITPVQISRQLKETVKGVTATEFRDFDRKIDIVIRGTENLRSNLDDLLNLKINGYPIRNFVEVSYIDELSYIERKDLSRVFRLDMQGENLTGLTGDIQSIVKNISLPAGYYIYYGGEWLESKKSANRLFFAFFMAVILVYLILAAQFESFKAPFIILFTVPLAIIGIIPALLLSGMSVNIMSVIGLVVVVGIVVNDGIIKIDFIRRTHQSGMDLEEAIHLAGKMRLRPILMTTVTTVFGLLPLALGLGPGAELQQPMAIAIIGGESVATVFTLFVLPVLYKKLNKSYA